jgi:glutamate transport system substrate-binding protein
MRTTKRGVFRMTALVLGLTLVAALGACGDDNKDVNADTTTTAVKSFPAGSTMARLKAAGTVKVGVKFDQPGFGLKNPTTGQVEGFDVEIAKKIAAAIDPALKVEYVESVSKNREPFIQDGTVDFVVATYTINDARKQVVDFAGPYFEARQDIMVKKDDTSIKSVTDLNGKAVCTVKGSTSATNLAAKAPSAKVTLFDTYSQCAEAMTDGRVVAVTTDNTILAGLVQSSSGAFKLVDAPFSTEPYGIGVKHGDDVFRAFINDQLEKLYDNGDWADAFAATLGKIGLKTPEPPKIDRYKSGTTGTTVTTAPTTTTTY